MKMAEKADKGKVNMKQAQSKKMTIQSTIKIDLFANFKESEKLENLLKEKLQNIYPNKDKIKIDWGEIHKEKLPKRLRKEKVRNLKDVKKQQLIKEDNIQVYLQKFVLIGFNCVVKHLQAGSVSSVIVNSKLPTNLLRFLLPLCQSKQVAVLGLNNLDLVTKSVLGFSSTVIGFLSDVEEEQNHFHDLTKLVKSIWIQSPAAVDSAKGDDREPPKDIEQDNGNKVPEPKEVKTLDKPCDAVQPPKPINLHLKRKSRSERSFVPTSIEILKPSTEKEPAKKKKKINFPYCHSKLL